MLARMGEKPQRFEGADGIRGLACALVLAVHASMFFFPKTAPYLSGCGKFGVWLFFVLSAFLLTARFQRNGFSTRELAAYAVSRFLRIMPLFAVAALLYWHFGTAGIDSARDVWRALTFQQGYVHLWTIPVEFKFYAAVPIFAAILIVVRRRWGAAAAIGATVAFVVAHQWLWPYWTTPENSIDTRWYLPTFVFGCLAAVCHDEIRARLSPRASTIVGVAVVAGIWLGSSGLRHLLFGTPADRWPMDKFIVYGLAWAVFILALADGRGGFGALLRTRAFRLLGAWSYSIYLMHWLVFQKLAHGHANDPAYMVAAVGIAIAAGAALSIALEQPMETLRHGLEARIKRRRDLAAAQVEAGRAD